MSNNAVIFLCHQCITEEIEHQMNGAYPESVVSMVRSNCFIPDGFTATGDRFTFDLPHFFKTKKRFKVTWHTCLEHAEPND